VENVDQVNNKRTFIQSKLSSKQKQIGKKLNNIHFNVAKFPILNFLNSLSIHSMHIYELAVCFFGHCSFWHNAQKDEICQLSIWICHREFKWECFNSQE